MVEAGAHGGASGTPRNSIAAAVQAARAAAVAQRRPIRSGRSATFSGAKVIGAVFYAAKNPCQAIAAIRRMANGDAQQGDRRCASC